jgi:hypothetical protein
MQKGNISKILLLLLKDLSKRKQMLGSKTLGYWIIYLFIYLLFNFLKN